MATLNDVILPDHPDFSQPSCVGPRSFHRHAVTEIKRGIDVMHRLLMLSMTLAFSSVTVTPGRAADRRPNVLFIAVDDLND